MPSSAAPGVGGKRRGEERRGRQKGEEEGRREKRKKTGRLEVRSPWLGSEQRGQQVAAGTANFRVCVAGVVSTGLFHITPSAPCIKLPEAEPPQRVVHLVGLMSDPASPTSPNSISPQIS